MYFCVDLYSIELYIQSADLSIDFAVVYPQVFFSEASVLKNPLNMGFVKFFMPTCHQKIFFCISVKNKSCESMKNG